MTDARDIPPVPPAGPLVTRHLPAPYRRAMDAPGDPMAALARSARSGLRAGLSALEAVQRARTLAFFDDLDDGARLGALHDQAPWPEDTPDSLRVRLRAVSALALSGAATAERMLRLVAVACGAELRAVVAPRQPYAVAAGQTTMTGTTRPGQTRGILAKPGGALLAADVLTAPARLHRVAVGPGPGFAFGLDNPALARLPDLLEDAPPTLPDPVFDVAADAPFGPFALIQRDLGRVIVVNRRLPRGGRLRVDVAAMRWEDHADAPPSAPGGAELSGLRPDLMAGISSLADDSRFVNEPGAWAAGYALDLRARDDVVFTGARADPMVDRGPIPAQAPIRMPSLLGEGVSRWRLVALDLSGPRDVLRAPFRPLAAQAPVRLTALWVGRCPGEFAVRVPPAALAPDMAGPLAHRVAWLDAMIGRFALAGCVRVADALLADPADIGVAGTAIALRDAVRPADALAFHDALRLRDAVRAGDALRLTPEGRVTLRDRAAPGDRLSVTDPTLPLPPGAAVRPRDRLAVTPAPVLRLRDAARPRDAVAVAPPLRRIELRDRLRPRDRMSVTPGG